MDIVLGSYPRNMRAIGMVGPFTNKADHGAVGSSAEENEQKSEMGEDV